MSSMFAIHRCLADPKATLQTPLNGLKTTKLGQKLNTLPARLPGVDHYQEMAGWRRGWTGGLVMP